MNGDIYFWTKLLINVINVLECVTLHVQCLSYNKKHTKIMANKKIINTQNMNKPMEENQSL